MIFTLCGSTRFPDAFDLANMHLSMQGHVVISVGLKGHADQPQGARFLCSDGDERTPEKQALDSLHYKKIDLSDAIYVINPGGYIGDSTRREIRYAEKNKKHVLYMFPPSIEEALKVEQEIGRIGYLLGLAAPDAIIMERAREYIEAAESDMLESDETTV